MSCTLRVAGGVKAEACWRSECWRRQHQVVCGDPMGHVGWVMLLGMRGRTVEDEEGSAREGGVTVNGDDHPGGNAGGKGCLADAGSVRGCGSGPARGC
jgi:hypothetical protein